MKNSVKKLFVFPLSVTALLILFMTVGCEQPKSDTADGEEQPKDNPEDEGVRDIAKPEETITFERAHAMYRAYQERFNVLTKFRDGEEDARFGWHSLEFYENYIAYLKQASRKAGIKVSGIRMYYVAYPEDEMSGNQKGYQTYIYVPTYYDKEKGGHIAFDPLHLDENGKPIPIHNIITKGKRSATGMKQEAKANMMTVSRLSGTQSSIANMGEMCKPNCTLAEVEAN